MPKDHAFLITVALLMMGFEVRECESSTLVSFVLAFTFITNLKLIFVNGVRKSSNLTLLHVDTPFFQHHLLKKKTPPLTGPGALLKNNLTTTQL